MRFDGNDKSGIFAYKIKDNMINRILIRIKVVQMLYSYLLTKSDMKIDEALKTLEKSMDKSYELYHYLLLLPIALTDLQDQRLDNARNKYLPDENDLNPNTKFVNNIFVNKLRNNAMFNEYLKEYPLSWSDNETYLRLTLDKILNSDLYKSYMEEPEQSLAADSDFWRKAMREIVLVDDNLLDVLEEKSVYWNDDLETIGTFVLKTIKKFADDSYEELLPQFKDQEDREFGKKLFMAAVQNQESYMGLIEKFVKKESWDVERLAFMDVVVLLLAIAEVETVPSVPTRVSLNEYIEIAKFYSTQKSGQFVNGILNAIIVSLKKDGLLAKN